MFIHQITRPLAFSTTAPLAANGVYTSPSIDAINYKFLSGRAISDQAGGFVIQHSDDGVNWDSQANTAVTASTLSLMQTIPFLGRYFRIVYTNGATAQTSFRLSAYLSPL